LPDKSQLYGDPDGKTFGVLHKLFAEMAGLFDDDVFNIGADETSAKGPCSVNSTFSIERKVVEAISSEYKKTPGEFVEKPSSVFSALFSSVFSPLISFLRGLGGAVFRRWCGNS
jgi:hypothetical protein